jgi:hypothetical protein
MTVTGLQLLGVAAVESLNNEKKHKNITILAFFLAISNLPLCPFKQWGCKPNTQIFFSHFI